MSDIEENAIKTLVQAIGKMFVTGMEYLDAEDPSYAPCPFEKGTRYLDRNKLRQLQFVDKLVKAVDVFLLSMVVSKYEECSECLKKRKASRSPNSTDS